MTLNTTLVKNVYAGDGSTVIFPVTFIFWDLDDLRVVLSNNATGAKTVWTRGTQYEVTKNLPGGQGATGTVTVKTTPIVYTPLLGETLTIISNRPDTQETSFPAGGPFPSAAVEQRFDQVTRLIQQRSEELDRAIRFPETDSIDGTLDTKAIRAGKFLAFNDNGDLVYKAGSDGVNSYIVQTITATAGQTVFSFANKYTPGINSLLVAVNGLLVDINVDYQETTETSITFLKALQVGDQVKAVITAANAPGVTVTAGNVSYTPAGAGAVVRNVKARLDDVVNVKNFGAVGDGVTDDTVNIQKAIDYAYNNSRGGVFFPSGNYLISQILGQQGISIIGEGMNIPPHGSSTTFTQKDGQNKSAIVNHPTNIPVTEFWHWAELKNFRIIKAAGSTDTLGSGIELNCRTGEGFKLEHLQIQNMPEDGVSFLRGGTPCYLEDLHLMENKAYGLDVGRTGGDVWQMFHANLISGDNNTNGLIRIKTAGSAEESFYLSNIKAEASSGTRQLDVVVLEDLNASLVMIDNISGVGVAVTGTTLIRIKTSFARLLLRQPVSINFTNILLDDNAGPQTTLAATAGLFELHYYTPYGRVRTFYTDGADYFTDRNPGALFQTQNAASIPVIVRGASGQSTNLQSWQNNAGSSRVWVDKDGHLATSSASHFQSSPDSPAQITGNQNDYNPSASGWWRLNSDASRNITGIAGGLDGRRLTVVNVGSFNIVLQNQNVGSAAANRIITGTGGDVTMVPDDTAELIYDNTTQRWRILNTH